VLGSAVDRGRKRVNTPICAHLRWAAMSVRSSGNGAGHPGEDTGCAGALFM
jgi:hypothetical protein